MLVVNQRYAAEQERRQRKQQEHQRRRDVRRTFVLCTEGAMVEHSAPAVLQQLQREPVSEYDKVTRPRWYVARVGPPQLWGLVGRRVGAAGMLAAMLRHVQEKRRRRRFWKVGFAATALGAVLRPHRRRRIALKLAAAGIAGPLLRRRRVSLKVGVAAIAVPLLLRRRAELPTAALLGLLGCPGFLRDAAQKHHRKGKHGAKGKVASLATRSCSSPHDPLLPVLLANQRPLVTPRCFASHQKGKKKRQKRDQYRMRPPNPKVPIGAQYMQASIWHDKKARGRWLKAFQVTSGLT